jgi:hypothetical protein
VNTAELLSRRSQGVRRAGDGKWMVQCPAHDDRNPSLSVSEREGKILLYCHAGCLVEAVVNSLRITMADLFTKPDAGEPRIVAEYDYQHETGNPLFQVVRYQPRDFKQRRLDRNRGGYFNDLSRVVQSAATMSGKAEGFYVSLNPVNPHLIARASNRLVPFAKHTASDGDIVGRCGFSLISTPCDRRAFPQPMPSTWPRRKAQAVPRLASLGNDGRSAYLPSLGIVLRRDLRCAKRPEVKPLVQAGRKRTWTPPDQLTRRRILRVTRFPILVTRRVLCLGGEARC